MKKSFALVAVLVGCGLIAQAGEGVKSGPQVGENARPKPFFPLNIKQDVQTFRVGVNLRLNPFGAGGLVAKY